VLVDHVPPGAEFVSVVVCPTHTDNVPPIALGTVFTVTTAVEAHPVLPIV